MFFDWNFYSRMNKGKWVISSVFLFNLPWKYSLFYKPLPVSPKLFPLSHIPVRGVTNYPLRFSSQVFYSQVVHTNTDIKYCFWWHLFWLVMVHGQVIILNITFVLTIYIQSNHQLWNPSTSLPLCCHHLNSSHHHLLDPALGSNSIIHPPRSVLPLSNLTSI